MKKNVFALLLTLIMVLVLVPSVLAATPADNVKVPSDMYVRLSGSGDTWTNTELVMTEADQAGTVDFKVELETSTIRNTIKAWYEYGVGLIEGFANGNPDRFDSFAVKFNEWPVTGEFVIKITFPATFTIPEAYTRNDQNMYGFNDSAKTLFEETSRTVSGNVMTIKIAVKDADNDGIPGIMEQALYDGVEDEDALEYLDALVFTVEGVSTGSFVGTKTVKGKMDGDTSFKMGLSDERNDDVHFWTGEERVQLVRRSTGGDIGGTVVDSYKITFNIDGNVTEIDPLYVPKGNIALNDLPDGKLQGYTFDGWYLDSERTVKVTDPLYVDKNMVLYGHRESTTLDTEQHYAYVIGYPDGTVRPDNNITREEVAMIFYRLLRDDVRAELRTSTNDFKDVASERWSNVAISTMAAGGFIQGYPDGTFRPGNSITRAEFATMATRFAQLYDESGATFADVANHWSKSYVRKAATAGWVTGYPDGTFGPENYITRAEVMTIINRVLSRSVNKAGLHADTRLWIDMHENEWFYYIVLEATNSHTHTRQADGINETWTAIIANKTWD